MSDEFHVVANLDGLAITVGQFKDFMPGRSISEVPAVEIRGSFRDVRDFIAVLSSAMEAQDARTSTAA